jgi:hypothetical protein
MNYVFVILWFLAGLFMLLIDLMDEPEVSTRDKFLVSCFYFAAGPFSRLIINLVLRLFS